MPTYDLIIVGAGPSGLACAIEAKQHGLSYLVIDKGGITDAIRRFPVNMTFFSTPELLEIGNVPFTLVNTRPTRVEALEYYRHVVEHHDLNLSLHNTVTGITSVDDGFDLVTTGKGALHANAVVVATGYFDHTNPLGIPGEDLPHVSHYYDEPYAYAGSKVVVIGGRNSAAETVLDLYRHGVDVSIVHRGSEFGESVKYWVKPDLLNRVKEGSIRAHFSSVVTEIRKGSLDIKNSATGETATLDADFVFALTGYRPDEKLLRDAGVGLSDELIPDHDSETFETNVPGLYIAGSVACGCRTWNIFIENGREHGKAIVKSIVGNKF